ncbi:hypothetical protein K9M79_07910 [Candidatus Woesearchaeota archaeon]|nr:hypothetical protein [Candidatus Woesearchaeota archaeon]
MPKEYINPKQQPLKALCNHAFYGAKRLLGKSIYISEKYDGQIASVFGFAAGVGAAELGKQVVFPYVIEPITQVLSTSITLDEVITASLLMTAGGMLVPKLLAPEGVKQWEKDNPTYAPGVKGVMGGAITIAVIGLASQPVMQYLDRLF